MSHYELDPAPRRRLGPGWWVYAVLGGVALLVAAWVTWSFASTPDDDRTSTTLTTAPADPTPEPPASVAQSPAPGTPASQAAPVPAVDPRCWASREATSDKGCQVAVAQKTKFIPRYATVQADLARAHPAVKQVDVGRGANSLARHGLMTCWMVAQPHLSLDDMRSAFYLSFHRHPFRVPNDDLDAAADSVLDVAVQEICLPLAPAYERKGGPKAELMVP